ncbi:hypothetical protein BO94DRAFT_601224 [Aspergillus sclerotioniger CBS 115572]|uniref:Rhodopsin domain-containing protein n=1 Tax=Aspergillus sclerotioniger CBS 115572 TaxID=1450535 RepID=A0A317XCI9_9EURO|nr:hypothetical protein BO94DRAFT_601224 [Aspergillus sclerotioniger CBS 115572]PWY96045.1 hypothetical protein BO94DRAFT_601224 [Aspergillus sclerotioniger CBS 115572]
MGYNLTAEMFSEWAIGLVVVAVRLYARFSVDRGIFRWDDLCLVLGTIFWTLLVVFLYLCTAVYGSNIGLNDTTAAEVSDDYVPALRQGSIYAFLAWLAYILMVWSFKGVLVVLYNRLTVGLKQNRLALAVGVLSLCTFITSLLFDLLNCRPIQKNWQIKPYAGNNCTVRPLNYIVIEVLSILTDLCIMCVPIPLIIIAKIPTSQKWILSGLFSSGIFVMVAAALRAYYSVKELKTLSTALGWASRQAFVSAIIVCAPGIKPLLSRFSWFASYSSSRGYDKKDRTRTTTFFNSKSGGRDVTVVSTCEPQPYELSSLGWKRNRHMSSGESQEHIMDFPLPTQQGNGPDLERNTGIMITTHVTLAHEDVAPDDLHTVPTTPPFHH